MRRIAYYAHHQGSGHVRNALEIARNPNVELLLMTSAAVDIEPASSVNYVQLETNAVAGSYATLGRPFHRTPVGDHASNIKRRALHILSALADFNPDVVVCDVSTEITALVRLGGYPVIVRRLHGDRLDHAHLDMYDNADQIISFFPSVLDKEFVENHAAKFTEIGAVKQLVTPSPIESDLVVVQSSLGGEGIDLAWVDDAARQTPEYRWQIIGRYSPMSGDLAKNIELVGEVSNVFGYLARAELIVTSGGQNAVRAAASSNRPFVVVPEDRPFNEQVVYATALNESFGIPSVRPQATYWPDVIEEAETQNTAEFAEAFFVSEETFHENFLTAVDRSL